MVAFQEGGTKLGFFPIIGGPSGVQSIDSSRPSCLPVHVKAETCREKKTVRKAFCRSARVSKRCVILTDALLRYTQTATPVCYVTSYFCSSGRIDSITGTIISIKVGEEKAQRQVRRIGELMMMLTAGDVL